TSRAWVRSRTARRPRRTSRRPRGKPGRRVRSVERDRASSAPMITPRLAELATDIAGRLISRGETVGVAEGSAGGLISASLLSVPGASAYFAGGTIVYTADAYRAF